MGKKIFTSGSDGSWQFPAVVIHVQPIYMLVEPTVLITLLNPMRIYILTVHQMGSLWTCSVENNVVSDITAGNVCKQQWNGVEKTKQIDRIKLDTKLNLIETRKQCRS